MTYVQLNAATVKRWCDITLKKIDDVREKRVEERVKYYMTPTIFLSIPIFQGMTRKEALDYIYSSVDVDDILATSAHWEQYDRVEDIRRLCEKSMYYSMECKINISVTDMSHLHTGDEYD